MPMNYTESSASIFKNEWFKDRVRIATSSYVNYLLNTAPEDPEYAEKINAATRMTQQYENIVSQLMFTLSGDAEVIAAGPAIADAQLQAIVEKTIAKFFPVQPLPPTFLAAPQFVVSPPPPMPKN